MNTKKTRRKPTPIIKYLSNDNLDGLIGYYISVFPEEEKAILQMIKEKQNRIIKEIFIPNEKKSNKKNAIQKEKEKRYRHTKSKARHILNANAVQRDLERKQKRMLRNRSVVG